MLVTHYRVLTGQEDISRVPVTKGKRIYFSLKKHRVKIQKWKNQRLYCKGVFLSHSQHIMQDVGRLPYVCKAPLRLCCSLQQKNGELRPSTRTTGKMSWSRSTHKKWRISTTRCLNSVWLHYLHNSLRFQHMKCWKIAKESFEKPNAVSSML